MRNQIAQNLRESTAMDVTFVENQHFFTNSHLLGESLPLNKDETNLSLPNMSNLSVIALILENNPSVAIESIPIRVDTSKLEDKDEQTGSITVVLLRAYSRRRFSNHIPMQTQESNPMIGTKSNSSHSSLSSMFKDLNLPMSFRKEVRKCN